MAESILDSMTQQYNSLTRSDKKLANYIFANTVEVQYLSINSLAENSGVSEATVTRFCRKMGLSGYNDLKIALAKSGRTTDLGDSSHVPEAIHSEDSLDVICQKLSDSYLAAFKDTRETLEEDTFHQAVNLLCNAKHVYCFGQGASMVMAMEAWARFSLVTSSFSHIADSHMQMVTTALATPEDVILFFSYTGSTKDLQDVFALAKERSIPIILITHFRNSAAADLADVVLLCGYNESPIQSGSVTAKMGQLLLIDCLFYAYCSRNSEQSAAARLSVSEAVSRKLL